uniref:Uncharacterized protein n=1 Tax=Rhizophora mucronata TaxID=61149 RepID=A0A2P2QRC1_RHIMU
MRNFPGNEPSQACTSIDHTSQHKLIRTFVHQIIKFSKNKERLMSSCILCIGCNHRSPRNHIPIAHQVENPPSSLDVIAFPIHIYQ